MFAGNYSNTIDDKNRVAIPARHRSELGEDTESVFVTRGIDSCLSIYTPEAWEDYSAEYIESKRKSRKNTRQLIRFLVGNSHRLLIDKQGRINIPQDLVDYAGLDKEIVFVGCIDSIELWSKKNWDEALDPANFDPDSAMEELESEEIGER